MVRFSKLLVSVCALFSTAVQCDKTQDEFLRRDPALVERTGSQFEAQLFLTNESAQVYQTPFNSLLDSRSLLESWMGKRQETCLNSGYSPCSGISTLQSFLNSMLTKKMEMGAAPQTGMDAAHSAAVRQD